MSSSSSVLFLPLCLSSSVLFLPLCLLSSSIFLFLYIFFIVLFHSCFTCASVWDTLVHEFHISYSQVNGNCFFSRGECAQFSRNLPLPEAIFNNNNNNNNNNVSRSRGSGKAFKAFRNQFRKVMDRMDDQVSKLLKIVCF